MSIADSYIRRQVLNLRFANALMAQYKKSLNNMYVAVSRRLAEQPENQRYLAIRADLQALISNDLSELTQKMSDDMIDFAIDESEFIAEVVNANSKVALRATDEQTITSALQLNRMDITVGTSTMTMADALQTFSESQYKQILTVIGDGVLLGDTMQDIAKKVAKYSNGRPKAQVESITRTLVNYSSNQARKTFAVENRAIMDAEEWVAVLDTRTSLICAGRDGRTYPVGSGPYPPAHYNCRSVRIPVLKSDFAEVGQKTDREDFDTWLRGQSEEFQDEYFSQFPDGLEKAKLFRDGGLDIQIFRDEIGKEYTLEQLRALNPVAFVKAGLQTSPIGG